MPLDETGSTVTFVGTDFIVGTTEDGGIKLTPVDDPYWWYRNVASHNETGWKMIVGEGQQHDSI